MANTFSQPDTSSSGAISIEGAIIGDNPTPYAAAIIGAGGTGDLLTTGDLSKGDAGEMSLLTEFAVEFWWLCTAFPGSSQNIAQGPISSTPGNNQWVFQIGSGNNIVFAVRNTTPSTKTATGATVLQTSTWYHIVGTAQGGSLRLYINGVQDGVDGTWGASNVQTMGTTAGSLDFRLLQPWTPANSYFDEVATYRTGLTVDRVLAHFVAGRQRGLRFNQKGGERMHAILDAVSSHAPRNIQTGVRTVIPRYMSGQAPLEEMRFTLEADDVDAQLFCSKSGVVTFLQDGHRSSSPYNTVQAVFGNAGGAELPYLDLQVSYDVGQVVNEWNVTRTLYSNTVPVMQTVSDATSKANYFKRSQSISDVPCTNDSDALTIGTELLAKYKDPFYMVTSLKPNMADQQTADTVYSLDLCDRIQIKWTPPGGGSRIDQTVFIQKIEHSGNPNGPPDCTLTVTPF